jgi:hypothetical protein
VREVVFRAVHLKLNAEVQLQAQALGTVSPLSDREIELSAEVNLKPSVQGRVWEYWVSRLPNTEPPRSCEHGLKPPQPALARTIA